MISQLLGIPEAVLMVVFNIDLEVAGTVFGSAILWVHQVLTMAGAAEAPVQSDRSLCLLTRDVVEMLCTFILPPAPI